MKKFPKKEKKSPNSKSEKVVHFFIFLLFLNRLWRLIPINSTMKWKLWERVRE